MQGPLPPPPPFVLRCENVLRLVAAVVEGFQARRGTHAGRNMGWNQGGELMIEGGLGLGLGRGIGMGDVGVEVGL